LYADVEDIFHLFLTFDKNHLSILILTEIVAWNKKIEERIRNAESKKTY
jgi:Ca2+-binding EF-hand superfamily protein